MMIESNFEINVSQFNEEYHGYMHFCRIELGSCGWDKARERYNDIKARFETPKFKVQLSYVECIGHRQEI